MTPFATKPFNRVFWALLPVFVLILASTALGNPSQGDNFTLEQPDGTKVEVSIWGDEYYRVVESTDGYTLVRDPDTGIICFAVISPDGSSLVSTGVRFDTTSGDNHDLQKHARINKDVSQKIIAAARADEQAHDLQVRASLGAKADRIDPTTLGDVKGITLIIDFSDEPGTIPASAINNYLNQPGYTGYGNRGSVRDYFYDVSDGLLTYTNHVPVAYYRANQPMSYYDDCDAAYGTRTRSLIIEALNHLNSQGFDFSEYDSNGDGIIDALNCFYAGYTSCGWAQGLWPHSSSLNWSADGVSTYKYQITGLGSSLTLSTFCHENGHMLCYWPDLYDYDGDSRGVGQFCLMCASTSSTNPQEPSAPMKYYANWSNVITLDSYQPGLIAPGDGNTTFRLAHPTKDYEYFLIENRQKSGRDLYLPDHGLAIWHVDSEYGNNNYQEQTASRHYEVTLVQADGDWDMENNRNYGDADDLFSSPIAPQCTPDTDPNTNWWDGSSSIMRILDISSSQAEMTFTYNPAGESHVPAQFPTIQAAIDNAANGETIVLADGIFSGPGNVDLDLLGKAVTLKALNPGPFSAVIDCGGSGETPHRAFNIHTGEGADTIIEGITIINGYANGNGGAIVCDGASPTLRGIFFSGNIASASGGAMSLGGNSIPVIENCVFYENEAATGGAFAVSENDIILSGCTFYGNSATNGAALASLGTSTLAVYQSLIAGSLTAEPAYCQGPGNTVTLECCDVFGNEEGNWTGCLTGQENTEGNFSLDPIFCDPGAGTLTLREDSPCLAGLHPDGASQCSGEQIGALGSGCLVDIFTAITAGPLAHAGDGRGAAWGDYDGDGDPDLFLVNFNEPNVLLRNDGNGVFSDVTTAPMGNSGPGTGAAWADYDNDGDLDLYVSHYGDANHLYRNDGMGGFVEAATSPLDNADQGLGVNWVDYDSDGNVDLFVVNDGANNLLIKNFGDLGGGSPFFFNTNTAELNGVSSGKGACWGDFDNDGDQDVYLVTGSANILLENGGQFGFLDVTANVSNFDNGSGAAWGDMNNDGLLDLYLANNSAADMLYQNGGGFFTVLLGGQLGSTGNSHGISWGDFDNDGLLDFMVAQNGGPVQLYWNHDDNSFSTLTVPGGEGSNRCVTWCDYDLDGDLDAYITKTGNNILLRNDFVTDNNWFHVELEGIASNKSAIGARVRVVAGGISQIREITAGSGYLGMNSLTVEFGLGAATTVDSLIINWPSGSEELIISLPANQRLFVAEGMGTSAVETTDMPGRFALHANVPNPFNPSTTINYELPAASVVSLKIYDIGGRLVRQLRSGEMETAGEHAVVWNGRNEQGHSVASGAYFYRLDAGGFSATHRMVLIK